GPSGSPVRSVGAGSAAPGCPIVRGVTRPGPRRTAVAVLAIIGVVALTACSHDGRSLRPARPNQTLSIITTTTHAPTTTAAAVQPGGGDNAGVSSGAGMTITTPWADGAAIESQYTCRGANTSPAVSWSGVPADTKELALAFTDLDADDFVHWVVAGLDPASTGLAAAKVPAGAMPARNCIRAARHYPARPPR